MNTIDQQAKDALQSLKDADSSGKYTHSITIRFFNLEKSEGEFGDYHVISTAPDPLPQFSATGNDLSNTVQRVCKKLRAPKEDKARELREKAAGLLKQAEQFEASQP